MNGRPEAEADGRPAATQSAGLPTDALLETVASLWPQASPRLGRRGDGPEPPGTFVVVPHARRPRLLVPAAPARAAATATERYSLALTAREVGQRLLVATALHAGAGRLLPDRVRLGGDPWHESIQAHLSDVLGERVSLSLGIGTARANRKPVLQAFDRRGRSVAFVKLGDTDVAARHVAGEVEALRRLAEADWDVLRVPKVLHSGTWHGIVVLAMTPLQSRPARPSDRSPRGVRSLRAAAEAEVFASGGGEESSTLNRIALWQRARATAQALPEGSLRAALTEGLARLESVHGDTPVVTGGWHGDWTPWNMARRASHLHVWDWERHETGVPEGLDAIHHEVNVALRSRGGTPQALSAGIRAAAGEVEELTPHSAAQSRSALQVGAYLVAITSRYATAAQEPGGEVLIPRTDLMGQALVRLSRRWTEGG